METSHDLGQRTMLGGIWLFSSRLAQQVVSLIQMTILAHLLDPKAFGLIALGYLATTAIGVFVYTGYEYALIQKSVLCKDDVHTAWWIILGRYLTIGGCLLLLANPIGHFYNSPEVIPVLRAIALIQPIYGLASLSPVLFRRNFQFRKIFEMEIISAFVGMAVGVLSAFFLRNVWALVLAYLGTAVTQCLLSYLFHPHRPRWRFRKQSFYQLSSYGRWMLGSAIIAFIYNQGSGAFGGWMFGITSLGLYQVAGRFALLPSSQIGEVILSAVMPAYSSIQHDKERISGAYLKTLGLAGMIILAMTALLALGLPRLFILLLGTRWSQAASLIPAIAVAGGAQAMLRTASPLFLGTGHPNFQFFVDFVQAMTMALLLYPLGHVYGLLGLPLAVLGGALFAFPAMWIGIRKTTNCTLQQARRMLAPAVLGVGVIILVFSLGQIPRFARLESITGVLCHLALIGISSLGFLLTIVVCQQSLPYYTPLSELRFILMNHWPRRQPQIRLHP